ncbi:hypothetical protein DYB32_010299, partial [Aphanomyces invadans]
VGVGNKSGEESPKAAPTKASKPKGTSQNTKFREASGHAVADDDIARCEAVADAFYKNHEDMDAFIEDILMMPHSQVYELTVRLGEGNRDWKENTLCSQFVKENPGSLWGSKFREILIHKRDPVTMQYSSSPLEFQLVTGDRFNPAPKRPLSPLSPHVTTSNCYALLQEDDLDLSLEDFALPRVVVEDPEFPRATTLAKKSRPNKSKHAHFERATKLIREKDVESNILACSRLLNAEPQVVAHSMYPAEAEFGLLKALASTRTIHPLMASRTENGESRDYTTYLPFYAKGCQDPQELVRELVADPAEYTVRLALGTVDLFLSNRAPDLYNNLEALDHFCGQRATRWETGDVLTDLSILKVARTLYPTLKNMNLPSFIGDALEFLVETVMDHSTNLDTLWTQRRTPSKPPHGKTSRSPRNAVGSTPPTTPHHRHVIYPHSLHMSHDHFPALPSELVDWDPQILSINTNGFSNSHRYILQHLSCTHDITFVQETRFRAPSLQDKVSYHWQRLTNHEGVVFFEPPLYPLEPTSPTTGGLATLIHPNSPLKNAVEMAHDSPVLSGRYLQIHCTLGAATLVLHNVYAPEAWSERARFFDALPRDFTPHFLHVFGGDFNCTLNKNLDSLSPSTKTMAGTGELTAWMSALSVVDLFRQQNLLRKTFTSPKLVNRLDYIFCSSLLTRYFADDSQLYACTEKSLHRQLALVQRFCDKSGFRLNIDKTQIL